MEEETGSELDQLLESLGPVESSGSFTIAADKALEKLARFQLPKTTMWLAKVFQAAHLAGVGTFNVEGASSGLRIEADCPEHWGIRQVEEALLSPHTPKDPSLASLTIGVRSAVLSQGMTLHWRCRPGEGETAGFVFEEKQFQRMEAPKQLRVGKLVVLVKRSRLRNNWSLESRFLAERAHSPVRLVLDGKEVEPHLAPVDPDGQLFQQARATFPCERVEDHPVAGADCRFWDLRRLRPPNPRSFVAWVKDGVIVSYPFHFRHPDFALQFFLSADHCVADLTGWQLRLQETDAETVDQVVGYGLEFIEERGAEAGKRLEYPRALMKKRQQGAAIGMLGTAALGGLLAMTISPHQQLALTTSYYFWYAGHVFTLLSPWLSIGFLLRWRTTLSQEKRLVAERADDLWGFHTQWKKCAARFQEGVPVDEDGVPQAVEAETRAPSIHSPIPLELLASQEEDDL